MRLSELLGRPVVDADGASLGEVRDIRLVQDGPLQGAFGAALRVDGLIVGRREVAARLGYDRRGVEGPWLVATIVRLLGRTSRFVSWDHVDASDHVLTVDLRVDELTRPAPLPQLRAGTIG